VLVRSIVLATIIFSLPGTSWAGRLDGSVLGSSLKPGSAPKPPPAQPKMSKQYRALIPDLGKERKEDLIKAVQSFSVILSRSKPGPVANQLILSRAKSNLSLAQLSLFSAPPGTGISASATSFLKAAKQDAEILLRSPNADRATISGALYVSGLAAVYSNDTPRAMAAFRKALAADPESRDATWMAFYLAEEYFEANKLQEAIVHYRKCVNRGDPKIRSTAGYKLAWAYLNAGNEEFAEKVFSWLPKAFPGTDIGRDAMRDLAFVSLKSKKDDEVLRLADKLFKEPKLNLDFLRAVFGILEVQGKASRNTPIFKRLLELEQDPIRHIQLHLSVLSASRLEYASEKQLANYEMVKSSIEASKISLNAKELDPVRPALDFESQKLIRSFVETFAGRVRSPEAITRDRIGAVLKQLFSDYDRYFPASPVKKTMFSLWLDVCQDLKDWGCVNTVALAIAADPFLEVLRQRAELDRIAALEELFKQDPKRSDELMQALQVFVEKVEASPAWTQAAKRLGELLVQRKDLDAAIALLERIFAKDLSSDSHYRLQWARFLDERYEDVLKNVDPPRPAKRDPRVTDIVRESSLKLAVSARSEDQSENYSKFLSIFLATNLDPGKATMARRDYISFLLEKSDFAEITRNLAGIRPAQRESEYSDFLQTTCLYHLKHGDFQAVIDLLPSEVKERKQELTTILELARTAKNGQPDFTDFLMLPKTKQEYLLGLLALLQPKFVINVFNKQSPSSENERVIALTALRFDRNNWDFIPTTKEKAWLGNLAPQAAPTASQVRSERELLKLRFPDPAKKVKNAEAEFTKRLQVLIEKTRKIRPLLLQDLKALPVSSQLRLLRTARNNEEKIASIILSSPLPAGLTEAQTVEYKQGLGEIAREFSDQADEWRKVETSASDILNKEAELKARSTIPLPSFEQWSWPGRKNQPPLSVLLGFLKQGNAIAAMILADLLREDLLEDTEEYYQVRAGILLIGSPSELMQRYVWEELMQSKSQDVIDEWKEAVQ